MIRWTVFFIISVAFVFAWSAPVYAAGGVSMTMEPNQIEVGKSGKLFVDVDPAGSSLNIIQVQVRYDSKVWNVASCTANDAFKGVAGQQACTVDATEGAIKLQMEAQSVRGPKQSTRVATVSISRKGTGNDTIGIPPGQIVVQSDGGQSSLLPMPDMVTIGIRNDGGINKQSGPAQETDTGISERSGIDLTQPPEPHDGPSGFFQSIISWFSRLFGR